MTYIKNALFLILCMVAGWGLARDTCTGGRIAGADFSHSGDSLITGTGDAPAYRGFILHQVPSNYAALLDEWHNAFATTVAFEYSPSLTRPVLTAAVKAAHQHQFAVILLPPSVPTPGNPYPRPLADIAADAQAARVDRLCISWLSAEPDANYWRREEKAIRAVYKGKLILAAVPNILPVVSCWNVADFLGVAGPIALPRRLPHASDNVTLEDFRTNWSCQITTFESFGKLNEKSIALLNMQVPESVSFKLPLPGHGEYRMPPNAKLQSTVYEALVVETKGRATVTDILLLPWDGPNSSAVSRIPDLMPKITAAWDPKKPRTPESSPVEEVDGLMDVPPDLEPALTPTTTTP